MGHVKIKNFCSSEDTTYYFLNHILLFMLLELPPNFPLCLPSPSCLRQSSHCCPCPWVLHICSLVTLFPMLHFTSSWLFWDYQFVLLNPFTFFTRPPTILPSVKHQNVLCIYESISVLLVYFAFYIQLLIDMYLLPFYCSYFWSTS